jgi:hypothetical protein
MRLDQRLADPAFLVQEPGIDPRTYFRTGTGASHAANVVAVATGQVDLATDFDRNFARCWPRAVREVAGAHRLALEPLPNDALACAATSMRPEGGACRRPRPGSMRGGAARDAGELHRLGSGAARTATR